MKTYNQKEIISMLPALMRYDIEVLNQGSYDGNIEFRSLSWDELQDLKIDGYFDGFEIFNFAKGLDNHICISVVKRDNNV